MIFKIPIENLRQYLNIKGWRITNLSTQFSSINSKLKEEEIEIIIPNNANIVDYEFRIDQLLQTLSYFEDRSYESIAEDMININSDIFPVTLKSNKLKLEDYEVDGK